MSASVNSSRRHFLSVMAGASGALIVGWRKLLASPSDLPLELRGGTAEQLGRFVRISADNRISIGARGCEVGQGVITSLPMLIAEELDVDWAQVHVEQLPYGYIETDQGPGNKYGSQGAGGSDNIPQGWKELRQAGATVRWLLLQAAASDWQLPIDQLRTEDGFVIAQNGRRASYGQLAAQAAKIDPPTEPVLLKTSNQFRVLGKPTLTADGPAIVTGHAEFGMDVYMAGTLTAVILRCPHLDGDIETLDDSEARQVPGVKNVMRLPGPKPDQPITGQLATGVAVIAENTWAAIKGRQALKVTWTPGPWAHESSAALEAKADELLHSDTGILVRSDGDFTKARKDAKKIFEARYQVPFLAHATMEPPNALIKIEADHVLLVASLQNPNGASQIISELTGIARDKIDIRMTRGGGGFGRRLQNDFVVEAVLIAKAIGNPIKLIWTREDDLAHDFYRPFGVHHLLATLDKKKEITGFAHRCAATSRNYRDANMKDKPIYVGCLEPDDFPAQLIANLEKTFFAITSGMPRGWWRAPLHTFHAFAMQSFIDELAITIKQDPVVLRLKLLGNPRELPYKGHGGPIFDTGRLANVLKVCAEKIGWGRKPNKDHGLGIACHFTFGGYAAHAFEVSAIDGVIVIHRALCVVDVGRVINPLGVEAQMIGGTIDGLSTAINLGITVKDGQIQQNNFNDYPLLRMAQAPENVEVLILPSEKDPSGAGEIGVPSALPALTNAIFAATGFRIRKLPIGDQLKKVL